MAICVNVRFLCREITGDARNGEYILPKQCTVAEMMKCAAEENGTFAENYMDFVLWIVNGRLATADTILQDGDKIQVAAVVYGG